MPGVLTVYRWELRKLRAQKRTYLGLGAAAVKLGNQPHDVQAEPEVGATVTAGTGLPQGFEQVAVGLFRDRRIGQGRVGRVSQGRAGIVDFDDGLTGIGHQPQGDAGLVGVCAVGVLDRLLHGTEIHATDATTGASVEQRAHGSDRLLVGDEDLPVELRDVEDRRNVAVVE